MVEGSSLPELRTSGMTEIIIKLPCSTDNADFLFELKSQYRFSSFKDLNIFKALFEPIAGPNTTNRTLDHQIRGRSLNHQTITLSRS